MDRGAARYRRTEGQRDRTTAATDRIRRTAKPTKVSDDTTDKPSSTANTSRFKPKVIDNTDPARFRPKAIRDSAALLWPQGAFEIPPSPDILSRVTRVDLSSSGCTDVSWLAGTRVTWLSVRGCKLSSGWGAVGSLSDLAVLNISDTGLSELPEELGDLHKLKALVAMGNPWTRLDSKVVEQWEQLNSLIVSHSPKLKGLPKGLNTLRHLAKLSFSHCPSLQAGGLPDFTDLPLLRDVKLNNLALLDKLPSHISTWGTGTLPASERSTARRDGDGLEVLDLGNCSLPYSTIEAIFLRKTWPHLRSLSLHSNPLAVSHPDYADLLQDSDTLPNLQIIDAKRVVERKRKGEVQETRLERRRRLKKEGRQSTGSNARIMTDKARMWGGKAVTNEGKADNGESSAAPAADASDRVVSESRRADALGRKRKRQRAETTDLDATATPRAIERSEDNRPAPTGLSDFPSENSKRRRRTKNHSSTEQSTLIESPAPVKSSGMPAATSSIDIGSAKAGSLPHGKRPRAVAAKVETIVDSSGGVNLKDVLGKPKLDEGSGSLGVGGW